MNMQYNMYLQQDRSRKSLVEKEREKQASAFKEVSMSEKIIGMKGN